MESAHGILFAIALAIYLVVGFLQSKPEPDPYVETTYSEEEYSEIQERCEELESQLLDAEDEIENAYNEGYEKGFDAGYENGYDDGLIDAEP